MDPGCSQLLSWSLEEVPKVGPFSLSTRTGSKTSLWSSLRRSLTVHTKDGKPMWRPAVVPEPAKELLITEKPNDRRKAQRRTGPVLAAGFCLTGCPAISPLFIDEVAMAPELETLWRPQCPQTCPHWSHEDLRSGDTSSSLCWPLCAEQNPPPHGLHLVMRYVFLPLKLCHLYKSCDLSFSVEIGSLR